MLLGSDTVDDTDDTNDTDDANNIVATALPLATDALSVPVTDAAGLAQGDAAGGARPLSQGAPGGYRSLGG